jgi:hypothetical protein
MQNDKMEGWKMLKLRERGGALVLAMIFITALSILCIGFMTVAQTSRSSSFNSVANEQALRMAQTAMSDYIQQANQHSVAGLGTLPSFTSSISMTGYTDSTYTLPIPSDNYPADVVTSTDPTNGFPINYYPMLCTGTALNLAGGTGAVGTTTTRYLEIWVSVFPGVPGSPSGPFPKAAFGKASAAGFGTPTVDSFNSKLTDPSGNPAGYAYQSTHAPAAGGFAANTIGAFHASATGGSGNVGSNGAISVAGATTVYGNLNPGPGQTVGGSPPAAAPSGVHGQVIPLTATVTLPDPTPLTVPPAGTPALISSPPSTVGANGATTVIHVSNINNGFAVKGDVTIYLDGDVSLSGAHNYVSIYPGAKLTIYQAAGSGGLSITGSPGFQQVDASGNSLSEQLPNIFNFVSAAGANSTSVANVNLANPATAHSSFSSSQDWHGNSDWASNVYAPFADVNFTGNGQHYGAVIANNLSVGGVSGLHEDLNAQSPAFQNPPTNPLIAVGSVREVVEVPAGTAGAISFNHGHWYAPVKERTGN